MPFISPLTTSKRETRATKSLKVNKNRGAKGGGAKKECGLYLALIQETKKRTQEKTGSIPQKTNQEKKKRWVERTVTPLHTTP